MNAEEYIVARCEMLDNMVLDAKKEIERLSAKCGEDTGCGVFMLDKDVPCVKVDTELYGLKGMFTAMSADEVEAKEADVRTVAKMKACSWGNKTVVNAVYETMPYTFTVRMPGKEYVFCVSEDGSVESLFEKGVVGEWTYERDEGESIKLAEEEVLERMDEIVREKRCDEESDE